MSGKDDTKDLQQYDLRKVEAYRQQGRSGVQKIQAEITIAAARSALQDADKNAKSDDRLAFTAKDGNTYRATKAALLDISTGGGVEIKASPEDKARNVTARRQQGRGGLVEEEIAVTAAEARKALRDAEATAKDDTRLRVEGKDGKTHFATLAVLRDVTEKADAEVKASKPETDTPLTLRFNTSVAAEPAKAGAFIKLNAAPMSGGPASEIEILGEQGRIALRAHAAVVAANKDEKDFKDDGVVDVKAKDGKWYSLQQAALEEALKKNNVPASRPKPPQTPKQATFNAVADADAPVRRAPAASAPGAAASTTVASTVSDTTVEPLQVNSRGLGTDDSFEKLVERITKTLAMLDELIKERKAEIAAQAAPTVERTVLNTAGPAPSVRPS